MSYIVFSQPQFPYQLDLRQSALGMIYSLVIQRFTVCVILVGGLQKQRRRFGA